MKCIWNIGGCFLFSFGLFCNLEYFLTHTSNSRPPTLNSAKEYNYFEFANFTAYIFDCHTATLSELDALLPNDDARTGLAEADKTSAEPSLGLAEADKASAKPSSGLAEADKASAEPSLNLAGTFDACDRFAPDLYHDRQRPFSINLSTINICINLSLIKIINRNGKFDS